MRLVDYLDLGASFDPTAPCLASGPETLGYAEVQGLSRWVAGALAAQGVGVGDRVATLSADEPLASAAVFGISRAGAVWCPVHLEPGAALNHGLLAALECRILLFTAAFADRVDEVRDQLGDTTAVCLDAAHPWAMSWGEFLYAGIEYSVDRTNDDDVAMVLRPATTTESEVTLTGADLALLTSPELSRHAAL